MIPHNKPFINSKSYKYISRTLKSGWINYGEISKKVENKLSKLIYSKKSKVLLVNSGTSALYLSFKALKIKENDEIIIPSYTCTALLNAINLIGAKAVICDIDMNNLSFTKEKLQSYTSNKTKAIIIVHTFGIPCEISAIKELNIPIIEDCSQALGSKFSDGSYVGSKGEISIFSFYATKVITGGSGGAVLSNNKKIITYLRDYVNFDNVIKYKQRFNFQFSDINASILLAGLEDLSILLKKKHSICNEYNQVYTTNYNLIKGINNFRYLLKFKRNKELKEFQKYMMDKKIKTIIPIKTFELLHNYLKLDKKEFPNSEKLSKILLSIPIYYSLTEKEIKYIKRSLDDYFSTSTSL
jgi:perosamine synthetase